MNTLTTATTLLIDIGNTRIKWHFDNNATPLLADTVATALSHHDPQWLNALKKIWQNQTTPTSCRISSVANAEVLNQVQQLIRTLYPDCTPHMIQATSQHNGFKLAYPNPAQMGSDRYAQLLGAQMLCTEQQHIVLSAGTATTIDGVLADGRHIGGVILPSMQLMRQSLHQYTAKLPLTDGEFQATHAPTNTIDALASAATLASLGTLNEFITRYMPSDDVTLILCGGNASALSPHIRHAQIKTVLVAPSLCLLGLKFWVTN